LESDEGTLSHTDTVVVKKGVSRTVMFDTRKN
jgi:hypothetical protein